MGEDEQSKILKIIRRSRRAFYIEYFCAGLLLFLLIFTTIVGTSLPGFLFWTVLWLALLIIIYAEIDRTTTIYKLMQDKMVISHGIIKKHKKNVYYHPLGFVTDINVHQSRIQRMLGVGSIYVKGGSENAFEIKDIDSPHKVLDFLEKLIHSELREIHTDND